MLHFVVPVVVVVAILAFLVSAVVSDRADAALTRASLATFGHLLKSDSSRRENELERMRAAHVSQTHRRYAARTLFISAAVAVVGTVTGVYLFDLLLAVLGVEASAFPPGIAGLVDAVRLDDATAVELFGILAVALLTVGTAIGSVAYTGRWLYLDQIAAARANRIDATLPRTVAFIYALSRSGMPFPKVLDTLAANRTVYGEAASELAVAVRDMETFGTDVMTALQDTADRTPSDSLEEFAENLASVLGSGRSLSSFLREQYERYQDEMATQQQKYLELLETFAEIYVTVLVAGPLFFVTVLVVIGLVIADTLPLIQVVTYVGIPIASVVFMLYIDRITESIRASSWQTDLDVDEGGADAVPLPDVAADASAVTATDGGVATDPTARARTATNDAALRARDRLEPLRRWLANPQAKVLETPLVTLYLLVPFAVAWIALRYDRAGAGAITVGPPTFASFEAYRVVALVDQPFVEATLVVTGVLSLVYELRKRKYRDIENATPDFLDRMASVNEAGLTIVASITRVSRTDLGELGEELRRANRDIEWGVDVATALRRMANRTRAPMLTRSVALITNAMGASGDISPVLRIAANETEETRTLRNERRQQMLTYLVVIYVSFFVFLGIITALTVSFVPAIESASEGTAFAGGSAVATGVFSGLEDVNTEAYTLLFFHISIVQGFFSGLIAGQLGEGSVTDGLKHATLLVFVTYLLFQVI